MLNEISNYLDYYLGFFGGGRGGRMAPFSSFCAVYDEVTRGRHPAVNKRCPVCLRDSNLCWFYLKVITRLQNVCFDSL